MKLLRSLTLARLVVILTFVAVFVMAARAPLDTDMLWHLRAGEWQVTHHALLRMDEFSHTRAGLPWINHSWLSQIILYGAYALLGNLGLTLYTAVLATAGMFFVYRQMEGDPIVRAFVTVLGAAAAAIFWSPRPQMMSFLLSTVVLYLLWLYLEKGIDRLWFIPLVMALWANLHGGFAIGFILMVLATAGEGVHWLFEGVLRGPAREGEPPRPTLKPVWRLMIVGLVSAAAISLNPYGPSMLLYPFRTVGIGVLRDYIQEWAAPNFHQPETWPFIWLLLGTLGAAAVSSRRLGWREAVMVAGTAYSALLAGRNIATFAVVASPVLSVHLDDWLKGYHYRLNWERRPARVSLAALNWLLLGLILVAGGIKVAYAVESQRIEETARQTLPVEAVAYLEQHHLPGPLFNSYNWGGYLIWEVRDYLVYVDGRTDLYDDELLRVYLATYYAQSSWRNNLDSAGINTVLIESTSPLAQVLGLSEGWRQVYSDAVASIFVREVPLDQ
jgi:hypothetical protein